MTLEFVNDCNSVPASEEQQDLGLLNSESFQILLVEDNPGDARLVLELLREAEGLAFDLFHQASLGAALAHLRSHAIDVILLDLSLPDQQGLLTVTQIQAIAPDTPIVIMSGLNDDLTPIRALQQGAQDYLVKGESDSRSLVRSIRYAIERQRMQTELKQVQQELQNQAERTRLLGAIAARIRQSLDLQEILQTAVAEVRQFLQSDRVVIYSFTSEGAGTVVAESIALACSPLVGLVIQEPWLREGTPKAYQTGHIRSVQDIYTADLPPTKVELLEQLNIKAFLAMPIWLGDQLWGVLSAHQCQAQRQWQSFEVDLLQQLATQVAIAIQQAQLYQQVQSLNANLEGQVQERTQQLTQEKALLEALLAAMPDLIFRCSRQGVFLDMMAGSQLQPIVPPPHFLGKTIPEILPPAVAEPIMACIEQAFNTGELQSCEYQLSGPGGDQHFEARIIVSGPAEVMSIVRDITSRKQAEAALRRSEATKQALLNAIPDMMFRYDAQGTYLDFIPSTETQPILPPEQLLGRRIVDALPSEVAKLFMEAIALALATGEIQLIEYQLSRDGRSTDYEARLIVSGIDEVLGIVRDITARKQAERALREGEANLFALIENTQDYIWSVDRDYRIITINSAFKQYFQAVYGVDLQPGMQILGVATRLEVGQIWQQLYDRAFEGERIITELEYHHIRRDVEASLNPILSSQGEVAGVSIFARDITARKQAEAALQESEALFRSIYESAAHGIVLVDLQGRYLRSNAAFLQTVGLNPAELAGRMFADFTHPDDLAADLDLFQQLAQGELDSYQLEKRFLCPDGQVLWIRLTASLVRDAQGQPCYKIAIVENIHERKQTENLLIRQQQVLEMMATGVCLPEVLEMLCCIVEEQCNQMSCSILLLDAERGQLRHGAAPSLPAEYIQLTDGVVIGPQTGSCGTAAYLGQPIFVTDIATDPLWIDYREFALRFGLRACWSLPILSEQGKVLGTFGLYYRQPRGANGRELQLAEITARLAGIAIERQQAEEALKFTQFCVDRAADAIFWAGPNAELLYVNDAACRSVGYSREELLSMRVYDISPRSSPEKWEGHWIQVKQRGSFTFEGCQRTKTGQVFPTEMTVNYVNFNGKEYICNFVRDITARKQAEENLRQSEARFRSLVRNAADGIALLDAVGTILYESPSVQRRLGYHPEELVGRRMAELLHPEDCDRFCAFLAAGLENPGIPLTIQYRIGHQDGSWRYVEAVGCNLLQDPSVSGIVVNVRDITDRHRYEMELCQAKDAAEAGSRAKSEFLAVMSHELRTPLNAILGLSELMRQEIFGRLNPKQQEYVNCIHSSGDHLLSLINDILDLSKVEAGKEELIQAPVLISDLCYYCLSMVQEQAQTAGLQLTSQIDPHLYAVMGDERRLRQILLNLLSNAIKFTPTGKISLTVQPQDQGIAFTVTDTGIGIAPEHLPTIFEPFHQVDSRLNRRFEGTGLGLALTQRLARLHGGDIRVASELGQGSSFTLYIPTGLLQPTVEGPHLPSRKAGQAGLELLEAYLEGGTAPSPLPQIPAAGMGRFQGNISIIGQDTQSAMLLQDYLASLGYRVEYVTQEQDCLAQILMSPPDLLLLDVQLPTQVSSFNLLRTLRSHPQLQSLSIVVISAMAMQGDRERLLAAGADEYLSKPIGVNQLSMMLSRYF